MLEQLIFLQEKVVEIVMGFNPVERAKAIERLVVRNSSRLYYKIKFNRYYGPIISCYTVGCCLNCAYCWNHNKNKNPARFGRFLSPSEVAERVNRLLKQHGTIHARITGGEPILGTKSLKHLTEMISEVDRSFLIETNGVMLGYNPDLFDLLEDVKDRVVLRVSIKGYDCEIFERVTGADGRSLDYVFNCIKELSRRRFYYWICIMPEVFTGRGIEIIKRKLRKIGYRGHLELETLETFYSGVMERIRKRGIELEFGYRDCYIPVCDDAL